jgi:hypothetical protein
MPNQFTPPNFHEDQPSAMETALATSIGNRNPMSALGMLIPEQTRRGMAQDDYHDTMSQINAMQQQNLNTNAAELRGKALETLTSHPTLNSVPFAVSSGIIPDLPEAAGLGQGVNTAAAASNLKAAGEGFGPLLQGGVTPTAAAFGQFIPSPDGQSPIASIQPPALVQAAGVRGAADIAGRKIAAEQASRTVTHTMLHPDNPLDQSFVQTTEAGGNRLPPATPTTTTGQVDPQLRNQMLTALHTKNPAAWKNVMDGGGQMINDPQHGPVLVGKDGTKYK